MVKVLYWFGALLFLSFFLRALFYLGFRVYNDIPITGYDYTAIPIGIISAYLSYMYFRKIYRQEEGKQDNS